MSLSLRAGRAALAEDMGMTLLPRAHQTMALCCWCWALMRMCEYVLRRLVPIYRKNTDETSERQPRSCRPA